MAVVWMVEDEAEQVLRKRRAFRDALDAVVQPASDVDAAELIYGELVTNTVRYANQAPVQVRLEGAESDPAVLIVRDRGPGLSCRSGAEATPLAESGRGLRIVEMLSRAVDVESPPDGGTVVRAVLPVTLRDGERAETAR